MVQTLAENGVRMCFANPGTTEMHMLAALGREPRMGLSLCLFEGVATGAADGYARMTGTPAAVLLHLGPGFAIGMANLHNARKADTPVFNIVGEHATYHLTYDAPLTADIAGMAHTVSAAVATPETPEAAAGATAHLLAETAHGGVATLIVPNDVAWAETEAETVAAIPHPRAPGLTPICWPMPQQSCAQPGRRADSGGALHHPPHGRAGHRHWRGHRRPGADRGRRGADAAGRWHTACCCACPSTSISPPRP